MIGSGGGRIPVSTGAAGAEEDALFSAEAMLCGWPDIMGKEDMVLSDFFRETTWLPSLSSTMR